MSATPGHRRPALLTPPPPLAAASVMLLLLAVASAASLPRAKRDAGAVDAAVNACRNSQPCGWAMFNVHSRNLVYYLKNNCECSSGQECLMAESDLYGKAFYRCSS